MKLLLFLTKRYLFPKTGKRLSSWMVMVATAGIFLATFMVLVALGVLAGYQKVYHKAVLGFSAHVIVFKNDGLTTDDYNDVRDALLQTNIHNQFSAYHFYETIAPGEDGPKPVIFKGVNASVMKTLYPISFQELNNQQTQGVYVGKDILLRQPQIKQDYLLQYLTNPHLKEGGQTKLDSVFVKGTFSSGYYDFDNRFVIMPLTLMQTLFFNEPVMSGVEIRVRDFNKVAALKNQLRDTFGGRFEIMTWDELNRSLLEALKLDRTVVFFVSFLIIFIACMNVFGFNFLFFIQKKREFIILKALGFSLNKMRDLLALLSFTLGGIAATLGAVCALFVLLWLAKGPGIPINPKVYYVDHIPVYFECVWFALFYALLLALCYLTSLLAGKIILK